MTQKGQIAHLDGDPSNPDFDNLVYLCLNHHDDFDGRTSQSKGYTLGEVKRYRNRLYDDLQTNNDALLGSDSGDEVEGQPLSSSKVSLVANDGDIVDTQDVSKKRRWRNTAWYDQESRLLYAFTLPWGFGDGICRIERINLTDGRVVIICEQVQDNPGNSVTNCVEYIATQVCEDYEVDPSDLVWIEHYDYDTIMGSDEWDLVTFETKPPASEFDGPKWHPMTKEDWASLGLRLLKKKPKQRNSLSAVRRLRK